MNSYNIPEEIEMEVRSRDKKCVYCGRQFNEKVRPSIEHIINDVNIISLDNIAICCMACNSSKSNKKLSEWINSEYCKNNNINYKNVSDVIKRALDNKW
jgi:hypothetical protein